MADLATTPFLVDADDVAQVGFDQFAAFYPGWLPTDGDFTTRLVQTIAAMFAENQSLATQAVSELVEFFGSVLGLPPLAATPATGLSTWTLTAGAVADGFSHLIPAGTNVALTGSDGTPVTFVVATDVTVAPGVGTTAFGGVTLLAADTGVAVNDLTGSLTFLDQLAFVDSAVLVGTTTGGADAESVTTYLARFQKFAQILGPRPILPQDFALLVQVFYPQVQRCLAIDEYNADTATAGEPRCVTVVPVDSLGQALPGGVLATIDLDLQARRELNFETFVIAPTYTSIDVTFAAIAIAGFDVADVQARAIAAVQSFLSPATWGLPPTGDRSVWIDQPKVRYQDAVTCLNNVDGLDYYTSLTVAGGTTDVTLTGPGALPIAGLITGAVSAP